MDEKKSSLVQVMAATGEFFNAVDRLRDLGVIHGPDYPFELSRYLCLNVLGMDPSVQDGCHGFLDGRRAWVSFSNCPHGNPLRVGDPRGYDMLIVVLGPSNSLRRADSGGTLLIYRMDVSDIEEDIFRTDGAFRLPGDIIRNREPWIEIEMKSVEMEKSE